MSSIKSKNYMEEKARHTLHHVCGVALDEWICADKPDLQSTTNHCGIEVVQDVHKSEQEMHHFLETIWGQPLEKAADKKIQRFEEYGGSLTVKDDIICGASLGVTPNDPNHLIQTVQRKIDLINRGGYQTFEHYGLYVFVETVIIDEHFSSNVRQVMDVVIARQKECPIKYDVLYLDQHYTLCVCDLIQKKFYYKAIPKEMRELIRDEVTNICPN